MPMQKRSMHAVRPHVTNQAGLFTSLSGVGDVLGDTCEDLLAGTLHLGSTRLVVQATSHLWNTAQWVRLVLAWHAGRVDRHPRKGSVALFRAGIDLGPA